MPVMNGFEYVKELAGGDYTPDIIFVTAYDKYAIEAIRHSAFDYILKPVGLEDIKSTMRRYMVSEKRKGLNGRFQKLIGYLSRSEKIKFDLRTGYLFVNPDELIYCEADGNYTHLMLEDGKEEVVSFNLGHVENQLMDHSFFRINRSVLVNLKHIKKLDSRNKLCELKYNNSYKKFKISSSKVKQLEQLL
jgi:two-component system LytT family response regulator